MSTPFNFLTTAQFAQRSHYSTAGGVKMAIHQGVIKNAIKPGQQWLIPLSELRRIKKKQRIKQLKKIRNKSELPLENNTMA